MDSDVRHKLEDCQTINEAFDICTENYQLDQPVGAMTKGVLIIGLAKALELDKDVEKGLQDCNSMNEMFDCLSDNYDLDEPFENDEEKEKLINGLGKALQLTRAARC